MCCLYGNKNSRIGRIFTPGLKGSGVSYSKLLVLWLDSNLRIVLEAAFVSYSELLVLWLEPCWFHDYVGVLKWFCLIFKQNTLVYLRKSPDDFIHLRMATPLADTHPLPPFPNFSPLPILIPVSSPAHTQGWEFPNISDFSEYLRSEKAIFWVIAKTQRTYFTPPIKVPAGWSCPAVNTLVGLIVPWPATQNPRMNRTFEWIVLSNESYFDVNRTLIGMNRVWIWILFEAACASTRTYLISWVYWSGFAWFSSKIL